MNSKLAYYSLHTSRMLLDSNRPSLATSRFKTEKYSNDKITLNE